MDMTCTNRTRNDEYLEGEMSSDESNSSSSLSFIDVLPAPINSPHPSGLRESALTAGQLRQSLDAVVTNCPIPNPDLMAPTGLVCESQAAFMRKSFHKSPRLPGIYRLSKLNGSSRNSYADSESENDIPDNTLCRDFDKISFCRGSSGRQSLTSMRSLPSRTPETLTTSASLNNRYERRRAFIPISTKMASRVISNATGDLNASHVDCRDFTAGLEFPRSPMPSRRHSSTPALHQRQQHRIVEETLDDDEAIPSSAIMPVTFITFKPPYGRNSICSSDDCSTSEGSSSPHSTVRRVGQAGATSSSPDLVKSSIQWFKEHPACRFSMSSQSSWFSEDELYSMRSITK